MDLLSKDRAEGTIKEEVVTKDVVPMASREVVLNLVVGRVPEDLGPIETSVDRALRAVVDLQKIETED
jgi:hypothetical protein